MENQQFASPSETSSNPSQPQTNLIASVLLTALISGIVFGLGGYYFGKQNSSTTATSLPSITSTPKVGLKTYTSSFEKLSFQYPADWKILPSRTKSTNPEGDDLTIESPNGKLTILWLSEIDGLGGSCDPNVPFGTEGPMGMACTLYEVVDKQKLPNADLYYVAYAVTQDGVNYSPTFAIQGSDGILTSRRTMGYMIFKGRNNGGFGAEMSGDPTKSGLVYGTKEDVQKFFATPEAVQAKQILLSVSY